MITLETVVTDIPDSRATSDIVAKKFGCNRETSGDARCGIKDATDIEVWFWMGVSGFGWIDDRSGPTKDTKE